MSARLVLALTLLVSVTVAAGEPGMTLWGDKAKLTCPEKNGAWFKGKESTSFKTGATTYEHEYNGGTDLFYCQDSEKKNEKTYFYIQGKKCGNCLELDAWLFAVVISVDVTGTALVMVLIYRCCRRSGGGAQKVTAPARNADVPLQDTTYQGLNHNTRSNDVYSRINNNRTG